MQFYNPANTRRYFQTASAVLSSRFYPPKVSATVMKNARKNLERSVQYELERQKRDQLRRGPRTIAKNPILHDNRRTKVFNKQFQENIGFVMTNIPELFGHGLTITKVSVTTNFSEVRVFWVCGEQKEETVSNLLETFSVRIKEDMKEVSGLGLVPRIQWIHDQNYVLDKEMEKIFERVKKSEVYMNLPEKTENVWEVCSESLVLDSDSCGLDRDIIIGKIETEKNKKQALHRSEYTQDDFQTAYRESINRNGLQNKIQMKENIRKFLTSRKKLLKKQVEENYS